MCLQYWFLSQVFTFQMYKIKNHRISVCINMNLTFLTESNLINIYAHTHKVFFYLNFSNFRFFFLIYKQFFDWTISRMSSTFESIFKTADDDDNGNVANTSLEKLFKTRKQTNPNTDQILNAVNQLKSIEKSHEKTSEPVVNLSRREKARLKVEKETRTIFIGNLPTTTKKEVMTTVVSATLIWIYPYIFFLVCFRAL
jgi:hypothetical protein